jgi:hypothetical protein
MTPPRGAKRPPPPLLSPKNILMINYKKYILMGIIGKREMSGISIYECFGFLSFYTTKKIFIK